MWTHGGMGLGQVLGCRFPQFQGDLMAGCHPLQSSKPGARLLVRAHQAQLSLGPAGGAFSRRARKAWSCRRRVESGDRGQCASSCSDLFGAPELKWARSGVGVRQNIARLLPRYLLECHLPLGPRALSPSFRPVLYDSFDVISLFSCLVRRKKVSVLSYTRSYSFDTLV